MTNGTHQELSPVEADYVRRGFLGKVGFGKKPCILVVDLNKGFTDPTTAMGADLSQVISAVNELLEIARPKGIPVIFTAIAYDNIREAGLWLKKMPGLACLMVGSGMEKIDERLHARPDEQVLVKKFGSCFFGTALSHQLIANGIDTIILTGTSTSGCIRATAVDALQHGFRAVIPREAVGDRAPEPHEASLFDIQAKYGDVVSIEDVKNYLETVVVEQDGDVAGQ